MKAFGASDQQVQNEINRLIKRDHDSEDQKPFHVYFDNWTAYEIFRRVISQFKRNVMSGRPIALDYSALTSVIGLFNNDDPLELFDQVKLIEHGYLDNLPDSKT